MDNYGQCKPFHRPKSCPELIFAPKFAPKSNNRWWYKLPLIYARSETAATSRMFKPLWQHGCAICLADGWYEWKKEGDKKQPCFIHRADGAVPADKFKWHTVTRAVGNVKNQGTQLIQPM